LNEISVLLREAAPVEWIEIKDESNLFGFGIGFPAFYVGNEGKKFFDVGYIGFIDAIQKRLPDLLK